MSSLKSFLFSKTSKQFRWVEEFHTTTAIPTLIFQLSGFVIYLLLHRESSAKLPGKNFAWKLSPDDST